jgi:NADH:ubiquinone oxidoreductase subunit 3 (subunit A)
MVSLEYLKIIVYVLLSFGLAFLLLVASLKISSKEYDAEKLSAYECGFTPIGDARQPFHVRFYLVGILFLLFDLEVIFLFPWALAMHWFTVAEFYYSFYIVMFFVFLLTVGYIYEWDKGALDWE